MWSLLVKPSATQILICKEKKNLKRREKLPSCIFHVRRKGEENRKVGQCWMGTKGNPYLYFMNLPLATKGPTITTCTAGCTNSRSCTLPPFTLSAQGLELFYGNPINDPRVHSHQLDQPCYELLCKSAACSKDCSAFPFPPSQAHTSFYNIWVVFWQDRWEQERSMSNTCCSFASPTSRLLCPFISFSTGQHLDAGLKHFFSSE